MSQKFQTGVVCALIAGREFIFQDSLTILAIYGLGPEMFDIPNRHLTPNQLTSLQTMMKSVVKAATLKERFEILQGTGLTGFAAGRAALTTWFQKQNVSASISKRMDQVLENLELLPLQLIQQSANGEFPDVRDADPAKEDIAIALFGDFALARTLRGDFRESLDPIIHHTWERHRTRFTTARHIMQIQRFTARKYCNSEQCAVVKRTAINSLCVYQESMRSSQRSPQGR